MPVTGLRARRVLLTLAPLVALVATSRAHAQALFTLPGDVRIVEVDDAASPLIGTDRHGVVWSYGSGGITCHDPADRAGAPRAFGAFDHVGIAQAQVYLDPAWDGPVSFEGVRVPNPDFEPGGPTLTFQAYRCVAPADLDPPLQVPLAALPEWSVDDLKNLSWRSGFTFRRPGQICALQGYHVSAFRDPRPEGRVMCVGFPAGAAPTTSYPLDTATLDARLGVPSWEATYPQEPEIITYAYGGDTGLVYTGPPHEGWIFTAPVTTTDDRVFFLATRQTAVLAESGGAVQGGYGYPRWLLELRADGSVSPRLAPERIRDSATSPLAHGLVWHAETRALLVAPNGNYEYGNYEECAGDGFGNMVCAPHGPGGAGFFYVPLDEPGFGYFSIRDALQRATACRHDEAHTGCTTYGPTFPADPAGRVILSFMNREYNQPDALGGWKDVVDTQRSFRLDFDPSAFDIDGDGLTRADEDLLGTSDYDVDSDHGATFDAVEAGVTGSDPADRTDDARRYDHNVASASSGYGTSRLIRAWLPQDVSDYEAARAPSLSPDGPLCFRGRCLDIHARVVMTYPVGDTLTDATVSADATFLAWREGTTLRRKAFRDGPGTADAPPDAAVETFVAPGELERFLGAAPPRGRLYPITPALTYWIQTAAPPLVVAFDADGKGSLVFDLLAAACDSELDACAESPVETTTVGAADLLDALRPVIDPIGFARATDRLLIGVQTNWRQFLVALAAGEPPVLLTAQSAPHVYPDWFTPTGNGHDYVEAQGGPALMSPDLAFSAPKIEGLEVWQIGAPKSYWGDVLLIQAWNGRSLGMELPAGALEAVWFPSEVAPGEVLAFSPYRGVLTRIGLRGGAFDGWLAPEPSEHGVSGIDVTADLRMCAANPRERRVREYKPLFGRAAPSVTDAPDIRIPDATRPQAPIDCAYGDDGALRVLVADPPAVWVRPAGATTFAVDPAIVVPAAPRRFVRGPSPDGRGFADIAGADDPAAGRVVTRAGVTVDIPRHTWDLRWNGVVVANLRSTVFFFANDPVNVNFHNEVSGDVSMVERADGRIALSVLGGAENEFPGPYLYDPRTGSVMRADEGHTDGRLLAVVPGGDAVDPWTGDRLAPPVPASLLGPAAPSAPSAPTGGTARPEIADPGCAGGGPAGATTSLALWLVLWLAGRRRRTTADPIRGSAPS